MTLYAHRLYIRRSIDVYLIKHADNTYEDHTAEMLQAIQMLGNALDMESYIQCAKTFRHVGITLSPEQEAQIREFIERGDMASAQRDILDSLGKEFPDDIC